LLVAAPNAPALAEARFFSERLRRLGLRADALVLNRVHSPDAPTVSLAALQALLAERGLGARPEQLLAAQADELVRARNEAPELEQARSLFSPENLWLVPVLAGDVRGLSDLAKVSRALGG
jgi:anion-transporting  ArsA/GET3 family ATPase